MHFQIIGYILLLSTWTFAQLKSMNQVVAWNVLEYGFPTDNDRQYAIDNGLYTANTGTPIDVGVNYRRDGSMRVFVTIPRFTDGIPFTLATITNKIGPNGPYIAAYPNYETNHASNSKCQGITSAFRVAIDECDQMWVIDSGVIAGVQRCPPQLLTYDLNTDKLINRYQFTTDVYTPTTSLFITPVVDIRDTPPKGRCQKAMVYIADVTNHGLVVYDSEQNAAWRIENKLMYPVPNWGTHTIAGESFDLMDGIFALSLTPRNSRGMRSDKHSRIVHRTPFSSGERYLYFHALASDTENAVPLRLIENRTIWQNNREAMPEAFRQLGSRGVQVAQEAMDSKGNIFANSHYGNVIMWNTNKPFVNKSFKEVANNLEQLQFASGMKVVRNPRGQEELWLSTCRFQKIASGTQQPNEINFRILACKIDDLLSDRGCLDAQQTPRSSSFYTNLILK